MNAEEAKRSLGIIAICAGVIALWIAVIDFAVGGLSLRGAILALFFVAVAVASVIYAEIVEEDQKHDFSDCICGPEIRYSTVREDPKRHRPSCPVRRRWEAERREKDCGCGPPPTALEKDFPDVGDWKPTKKQLRNYFSGRSS